MAVHNGQHFLGQAIESILNQSYSNFELIIVNDHSTDDSQTIIDHYSNNDSRIIQIKNQKNQGLTKSLNLGINLAQGTFVARMDADDISHPARFEKQINFLKSHTEIGLLGTNGYYIDENGKTLGPLNHYENDLEIRWGTLFNSEFLHSSIMFRRDLFLLVGGYAEENKFAQDYELYSRLLNHTKGANLKERLVYWRRTGENITSQNKEDQLLLGTQTAINNINQLFNYDYVADHNEMMVLRGFNDRTYNNTGENQINRYLQIIEKFKDTHQISPAEKNRFITGVTAKLFESLFRRGINDSNRKILARIFKMSPIAPLIGLRNMFLRIIKKRFAKSK